MQVTRVESAEEAARHVAGEILGSPEPELVLGLGLGLATGSTPL